MGGTETVYAARVSEAALQLLSSGAPIRVVGTPGRSVLLGVEAEELVFLHAGDRPASPCAICVAPGDTWDEWMAGVATGAAAEISGEGLLFAESGRFVDFRRATSWDPRVLALAPGAADWLPVLTRSLATRLGDGIVSAVSSSEGTEDPNPLTRRARPAIARLSEAVDAASPAVLLEATADLVGLGPGLTPSGDDLLVGFLGTLRLSGPDGETLVDAVAGPLLALAVKRTTLVSRSFLCHALRGEFAAPVKTVLDGLRPSTPSPLLEEAVATLLAWGHSSGADTLAGIVVALRVSCQENPERRAIKALPTPGAGAHRFLSGKGTTSSHDHPVGAPWPARAVPATTS